MSIRFVVVVMLALIFSSRLHATTPLEASLSDLACGADHVFVGQVVGVDMIDAKAQPVKDRSERTGPGLSNTIRLEVEVLEVIESTSLQPPKQVKIPLDSLMHYSLGQISDVYAQPSGSRLVFLQGENYAPIIAGRFFWGLDARDEALALRKSCKSQNAPAKVVFEQLKSLVGTWRTSDPKNSTVVEVKLIANGSTLVETWTMSPTRQSMTVYTLDGNRLLATHYCPQGNAPRLVFSKTDASGAHHFEFLDGANLQDPKGSHEHAFWIRSDPSGSITRNETYIANGAKYDPEKDVGSTETFARVK